MDKKKEVCCALLADISVSYADLSKHYWGIIPLVITDGLFCQ